MTAFRIILVIFLFLGLSGDFKKDKGSHKKAKTYHAICTSILLFLYAGSLRHVFWFFNNFQTAIERIKMDTGILPGEFNLVNFIAHMVLVLIVLFAIYGMIGRQERSRRIVIRFLPFLAITEIFTTYSAILTDFPTTQYHLAIFAFAIILIGGSIYAIIRIYKTEFMNRFFSRELEIGVSENKVQEIE
jgi:hypothetical protein